MRYALMLVTISMASLGCAHVLSANALYQVTDLGTLGGANLFLGSGTGALGLNDLGQVTGESTAVGGMPFAPGNPHAFLYSNGQITDLGTLGGRTSVGFGINNRGQVTGAADTLSVESRAFLYSNGQMMDLGTLGGGFSQGRGVNDLGQVTGDSTTASDKFHGFLYSNGQMADLGTLGGPISVSGGVAINNVGQVTGSSNVPAGVNHAFLYSNGQMADLGTFGGDFSTGQAINDSGQVTGYASTLSGVEHAFLYSNGQMIDLGTLGGAESIGSSINNAGQVVGSSQVPSGMGHAFLYSNGRMTDLNNLIDPTLGITLGSARGINNNGQIIANGGRFGDSDVRAFLLTPAPTTVPEPDTWALLGLPLLALLLVGGPVRAGLRRNCVYRKRGPSVGGLLNDRTRYGVG